MLATAPASVMPIKKRLILWPSSRAAPRLAFALAAPHILAIQPDLSSEDYAAIAALLRDTICSQAGESVSPQRPLGRGPGA